MGWAGGDARGRDQAGEWRKRVKAGERYGRGREDRHQQNWVREGQGSRGNVGGPSGG